MSDVAEAPGLLYLLHFTVPLGDVDRPHMSARHYLGFTEGDLDRRLRLHRSGRGPSITCAAVRAGAELLLAATWPGSRTDERRRKNRGHFADYCSVCREVPRD